MHTLSFSAAKFSGYAACPIKRLHLQPYRHRDLEISRQLEKIGEQAGFVVCTQTGAKVHTRASNAHKTIRPYNERAWGQDNKFFQKTDNGPVLRILSQLYGEEARTVQKLGQALGIPTSPLSSPLEGGNFFLGRKADGQRYAIMGKESLRKTAWLLYLQDFGVSRYQYEAKPDIEKAFQKKQTHYLKRAEKLIAQELQVPGKQVLYVDQPDFHIDLAIRPLHDNVVLLHDPALSFQMLSEAYRQSPDPQTKKQLRHLRDSLKRYLNYQKRNNYKSVNTLQQQLQQGGFQVVRMPGIFKIRLGLDDHAPLNQSYRSTAFLNAVVHQKPNGDLVYITNQSYLPILNTLFAKYLQQAVPAIKTVAWVTGHQFKIPFMSFYSNDISHRLDQGGGIHCLSSEEPDFEAWDF